MQKLVQEHGKKIPPIVFVNGFVMITGCYPTNEEIRQILNTPQQLIEPKQEGCCLPYCDWKGRRAALLQT